jgi:hypothetical protein
MRRPFEILRGACWINYIKLKLALFLHNKAQVAGFFVESQHIHQVGFG